VAADGGSGVRAGERVNLLRCCAAIFQVLDLTRLSTGPRLSCGVDPQDATLGGRPPRRSRAWPSLTYPTALALSADGAFLGGGHCDGGGSPVGGGGPHAQSWRRGAQWRSRDLGVSADGRLLAAAAAGRDGESVEPLSA